MRKIAAVESFFSPEHRETIEKTAAECGFTVDYFSDGHLPADQAADYEIIYGLCSPKDIKAAVNLRWLCCSFAGVDAYTSDDIYPHPDVLLSNSSGAYGVTISEHIIMVTLMLLRQMPVFEQIVRERGWEKGLPMRSICGSSITVLGTGDIGTNFARRAKALGAKVVRGVRRTKKAGDPAYDEMYTLDELDSVLPKTEILVMALPGTKETAHILSRERIALLPRDAYVVNVGRGTAIDQEALMEALNAGRGGTGCVCAGASAQGSSPVGHQELAAHPPHQREYVSGHYKGSGRGAVLRGSAELRRRAEAEASGGPGRGLLNQI